MKKRMLSLALAVGMTLTTLTGCGSSTGASSSEGADGSATAADPVTTAAEQLLKHSDTAGKEETVYVIADANGKANKVIVSEWLKNQKGSDTLKDQSNLKDVKNVKGDQDFTKGSGDELTWNAKGSDIYYQGTSDKQLPVDVTVTYKLNGKTVSAKELDGASGKLTMEFTYKNNTGKTKKVNGKNVTIYQPFLMVSGLLVDNDKMSNVEVTNGKVINSGDKTVVVGMALPGLEESLGLADLTDSDGKKIDIDVPQKVTIKADVSDFSLLTTVTMASNSALEELNLDDVDSVDDLKDSLKKLGDSSKELVDGTKKLEDGVGELNDKSGDLADGVDQVNQGAKDLDKGAKDLNNGAKDLDDGTNELATQVKDLPSSAQQLLDGAKSIKSALGNADSETQTIYTGAAAIEEGAQQMSDNLKNTNGKSIYEAAAGIQEGAAKVTSGADQLSDGLNTAAANLDESIKLLNAAVGQLEDLQKTTEDTTTLQTYGALIKEIKGSIQYQQGVKQALTSTLQSGITSIKGGATLIDTYAGKIADGSVKLVEGAAKLEAGAKAIQSGVDTMISGNNGQNLNAMIAGLSMLSQQSGKLVAGTQKLADGSGKLLAGTDTLTEGTGKLASGTGELSDGTDKLISGIGELLDGSKDLAEGMAKFDEEGIQKLTSLTDGDLGDIVDRLEAVQDYAKEYKSYGGCPADLECSTKFIYKTDSIGE
ncbi:MAG: hypothetical protein V8S71_07820 [Oscillospiraceae bacterium]|jgi:putative membrane protein